MSRISVRVEDVLTAATAIALVAILGAKAAGAVHLTEANRWDFAFLLLPVALLVLSASIRYAFRPVGESHIEEVSAETGHILRDWSPFLLFLMLYESFRVNTWTVVSPEGKDAMLLGWDRALFGETPSATMDGWINGGLTQLLSIAYFLHIVMPPVMGLLWYRRDLAVFRQFVLAVLLAGIIGAEGYAAVPAIGPGAAFPSLYHHALSGGLYENMTTLLDAARAPRDVFPSLHVGISSIVLWYAWRRGRTPFAIALPLVLLNWLSTVYLRYHYMVDVIAGWAVAGLSIALSAWLLRVEATLRARFTKRAAAA